MSIVFRRKNEGFPPHIYDFLESNVVRFAKNLLGLFRLLDILKETEIFRGDHPFLNKDVKVDEALLELLSEKEDGDGSYLMGLDKGEGFKKLIHGAESSEKRVYSSLAPLTKHGLAHSPSSPD